MPFSFPHRRRRIDLSIASFFSCFKVVVRRTRRFAGTTKSLLSVFCPLCQRSLFN
jgi:hypothetical protein